MPKVAIPEFCIQVIGQCKRAGIRQSDLAEKCNVSGPYMSRFLNGHEDNENLAKKILLIFPEIDVPYQYTSPETIIAGGKESK